MKHKNDTALISFSEKKVNENIAYKSMILQYGDMQIISFCTTFQYF